MTPGWQISSAAPLHRSAWLRHAVHLVTVADFPARWQAASTAQGRAPPRERESRTDHERFMLRLDDASRGKLDACTRFFVTARADVIRQLITQATPETFPQSWHLAAAERRQRQASQAALGQSMQRGAPGGP